MKVNVVKIKGKKREPFSPKASNNIPCTNCYIISAIDCHLFGTNVLFIKVTKKKARITITLIKRNRLELVKLNLLPSKNVKIGTISNCSKGE